MYDGITRKNLNNAEVLLKICIEGAMSLTMHHEKQW